MAGFKICYRQECSCPNCKHEFSDYWLAIPDFARCPGCDCCFNKDGKVVNPIEAFPQIT